MIRLTLHELILGALHELERPTDDITVAAWRERLTAYANEAVADLSRTFRLWRRDPVMFIDGKADLDELPFAATKVLGVEREGVRLPFGYGASTRTLTLKNLPDGIATVVYRYAPKPLREDSDVPDLMELCHPLIVLYMVARDRSHGDTYAVNTAKLNLSLYEAQKRKLRTDLDEPYRYRIYNRYL